MTQTRTNNYKKLDIWKSFVNYKKNNFLETEFIINHQKKSPIKTYKIEKFNDHIKIETPLIPLSKARNKLLEIAINHYDNYDYFLFLDDDSYLYDYNLLMESLIYCKINQFKGLIIGSIYKPNLKFINKHMKFLNPFKLLAHKDHNLIMGSCICFGRDLISKNIRFDIRFGLGSLYGGSEETDLFFNTLNHKISCYYNQCFIVIHPPTYKNQYSFQRMFQYGKGRGAVYRKYLSTNKSKFFYYLIYGLIGNFILSMFGLITFQRSYFLRNIGLLIGKLNGFLNFKRK